MATLRDFLEYPSFYSLVISSFILLVIFILFFKSFNTIWQMKNYKIISLLCVMSIAVGSHGLLYGLFETADKKPNLVMKLF
jgi:phosphoglycerol transferase MdoB-like AlkP superfamily enzyme